MLASTMAHARNKKKALHQAKINALKLTCYSMLLDKSFLGKFRIEYG